MYCDEICRACEEALDASTQKFSLKSDKWFGNSHDFAVWMVAIAPPIGQKKWKPVFMCPLGSIEQKKHGLQKSLRKVHLSGFCYITTYTTVFCLLHRYIYQKIGCNKT